MAALLMACFYCGEPAPATVAVADPVCQECQRHYAEAAAEARRTRGGYGVADETEVARLARWAITAQGRYHQHRDIGDLPLSDSEIHNYALGYIPCGRCGTFTRQPGPRDDQNSHYVVDGIGGWLCTPDGILRTHEDICAYDARVREGGN